MPEGLDPRTIQYHPEAGLARRKIVGGVAAAGLTALAALGMVNCNGDDGESRNRDARATATTEADPTTTAESLVCEPTWEMPGVDHGERNRWFSDGIVEIKQAQPGTEQARDALSAWLHGSEGWAPGSTDEKKHPGVKHDAVLLATGYNLFVTEKGENELKPDELVDGEGCATQRATQALAELEAALAISDVEVVEAVDPETAATGVNTGTDENGNVTRAETPGVHGDTKSLKVTTKDGCTVFILARCGQVVITKTCQPPADIPPGPTDQPPVPTSTTTTPEQVPPKVDDGKLPGDGTPAAQDPGTPDKPGQGPAGQEPGDDGYLPGETRPSVPQTTSPTTSGNTTPTTNGSTPTTGGPQPTAPPSPPTTGSTPPNTGTMPSQPPV